VTAMPTTDTKTLTAARRTHRILQKILGGQPQSAPDVCEEFGCSPRQARRYLRCLRDLYDLDVFRAEAGGRQYYAVHPDRPVDVSPSARGEGRPASDGGG